MTKTVLIKILVSVVTVVGIVLILHVNLLFPWQWTARKTSWLFWNMLILHIPTQNSYVHTIIRPKSRARDMTNLFLRETE